MTILVDTHAVLWWLAADKQLSRAAIRILENPVNRRVVSMVSLWEIAIKMASGGLPTKDASLRTIADQLEKQRFILLPIKVEHLLRLDDLPWFHRDPFDRLLIAQALEEGVPFLTADAAIARYAVETTW